MKIGYPCINRSLTCRGNKTFRLASWNEGRFVETVANNLDCLLEMLRYNHDHHILFFRISSDIIPFASHPVCTVDWPSRFRARFQTLGDYARRANIRLSMHPDQFVLINSKKMEIFYRSVGELAYQCQLLDLMELDDTHKIQIHVGGVYGDKTQSLQRFIQRYGSLDPVIKKRLVIENDDRSYSFQDCLKINQATGIPIVFDVFHHALNNNGEPVMDCLQACKEIWRTGHGLPMVDYSSQAEGKARGSHAPTIDMQDFQSFLAFSRPVDFDVMLEIKDKEKSALKAQTVMENDPRFYYP